MKYKKLTTKKTKAYLNKISSAVTELNKYLNDIEINNILISWPKIPQDKKNELLEKSPVFASVINLIQSISEKMKYGY